MPSELWQRILRDSPREVASDEGSNKGEESGPASPGPDEMAVHGSDPEFLHHQAMNEVRDMEFEMMGRLEDERVLREKQLKVMSQQSKKLDGHSAMLEQVLAGQRVLNKSILEVRAQEPQMVSAQVTAPAEPQAKIEAPVMEALHKIQVKMQEIQESMAKAASDQAAPTRKTDEAEVVVEFGGLWYEGQNKNVISGKFLHDAAGEKVELNIYNQREFSARSASLGHAHITKDGQGLNWSSGRVWTRAPMKRRENLQDRLQRMRLKVEVGKQAKRGRAATQPGEDSEDPARTSSVHRAYAAQWAKNLELPEELTGIRSIFGDSLRDHSLRFHEGSKRGRFLRGCADVADWVDALRRVPMPRNGALDRVVTSNYFELISATLIIANAFFIGVSTNWFMENPLEKTPELMSLADFVFVILFTLELGLRACSLRNMFFFGPDAPWYCFDVLLIGVSLWEIFGGSSGSFSFLRLLRVLKLARVIRMVRTLRVFGELRLILDCMLGSFSSLFWCLLVIAFVFYLFAVVLVQGLAGALGDIERELSSSQLQREAMGEEIKARWGSVSKGMLRLWEAATGGIDWETDFTLVSTAGVIYSMVFIGFIAFMIIVVWNIVTSIILQKALTFAQPDVDQLLMDKRRRDHEDVQILLTMLKTAGIEVTHKIREEDFLHLLAQKDLSEFLQVRGIDIKEAHAFFGLINEDAPSDGVDTLSFIAMCLRIKGFATSIDLHTIHFQTVGILKRQGKLLTDTISSLHEINKNIQLQREEAAEVGYGSSEASDILSVLGGGSAARGIS